LHLWFGIFPIFVHGPPQKNTVGVLQRIQLRALSGIDAVVCFAQGDLRTEVRGHELRPVKGLHAAVRLALGLETADEVLADLVEGNGHRGVVLLVKKPAREHALVARVILPVKCNLGATEHEFDIGNDVGGAREIDLAEESMVRMRNCFMPVVMLQGGMLQKCSGMYLEKASAK
jgi:hypothetical protein